MKYVIDGGNKLEGSLRISGNKNSVFPCFAAALLTDDEVILENVPDTRDTEVLIQILERIGVHVKRKDANISLRVGNLKNDLPDDLMKKLRGAIVLVGAILSRNGKVKFHHPGGDVIGRRGFEVHLESFQSLGAKVTSGDLKFQIWYPKRVKLKSNRSIFQSITSVTGTENIILASVLYPGKVIIRNCAADPHVVDLCLMLKAMGAHIEGIGTTRLAIEGVKKLQGVRFKLSPDHLEIGTYAVAAALTGGKIIIRDLDKVDVEPILIPLSKFGLNYGFSQNILTLSVKRLYAFPKLITGLWPGFPTDMMSSAIVLATQSKGITLCHDWIYESRMFFVDKLIAMGANITIADPHRVLIYGPTLLKGRELESPDIRAGMALVLAALTANGKSIINRAELVERGYENVVNKLSGLGAKISREE